MAIDLTDLSQVSRIIQEIDGSENRDRKKYEWQSYETYSGDQRKHTLSELARLFPQSWNTMRISNVNVLKKVVDKIARSYKSAPVRLVNNEANDNLQDIYVGFNQSFKRMDVGYNRHKTSLVWVQNNPLIPTDFKLKILDPYLYDLVINPDTNEIEVVILSYPDTDITHFNGNNDVSKIKTPDSVNQTIAESEQDAGSQVRTFAMWSKDQSIIVTARQKMQQEERVTQVDFILDESNPNMINPIGTLPFVWLTIEPDVPDFPISSALPYESININVLNSDLLTASAKQGFGMMVLKYPEGSQIKQLHTGFDIALELPQKNDPDAPATTAEFINANPDLKGMKDTIMEYAEAIISDHGLQNFNLVGSNTNFTSGFDRALSMVDVTEIREENMDLYEWAEKEVFEIIKKYDQLNKTRLFNIDDELTVQFSKPNILQSEKEILETIDKKLSLGLIQKFEALMMLNPNMTEEQALEKLGLIKQERQEVVESFMGQGIDNNADNKETEREEVES